MVVYGYHFYHSNWEISKSSTVPTNAPELWQYVHGATCVPAAIPVLRQKCHHCAQCYKTHTVPLEAGMKRPSNPFGLAILIGINVTNVYL